MPSYIRFTKSYLAQPESVFCGRSVGHILTFGRKVNPHGRELEGVSECPRDIPTNQ